MAPNATENSTQDPVSNPIDTVPPVKGVTVSFPVGAEGTTDTGVWVAMV